MAEQSGKRLRLNPTTDEPVAEAIRGSSEDDRDATDPTGSDPGASTARGRGHRAAHTEPVDFALADRASAYEFIRRTLVQFDYAAPGKTDKSAVKASLAKIDGAVARAARPADGAAPLDAVHPRPSQRRGRRAPSRGATPRPTSACSPRSTPASGQRCGPATRAVLRRRYEVFGTMRASRAWRGCRTGTRTTCAPRAPTAAGAACSPRPEPGSWPSARGASPAPTGSLDSCAQTPSIRATATQSWGCTTSTPHRDPKTRRGAQRCSTPRNLSVWTDFPTAPVVRRNPAVLWEATAFACRPPAPASSTAASDQATGRFTVPLASRRRGGRSAHRGISLRSLSPCFDASSLGGSRRVPPTLRLAFGATHQRRPARHDSSSVRPGPAQGVTPPRPPGAPAPSPASASRRRDALSPCRSDRIEVLGPAFPSTPAMAQLLLLSVLHGSRSQLSGVRGCTGLPPAVCAGRRPSACS